MLHQILFVTDDDVGDVLVLRELLYPLEQTFKSPLLCKVKDHEARIESLDVRAHNVSVALLACGVPNSNFRVQITIDVHVDDSYVSASRLQIYLRQRVVLVYVLLLQIGLSNVHVS